MESISPKKVGDGWKLIGYDVADYYLGSGIVGTYGAFAFTTEQESLWAGRLNRYHLFDDVKHAVEFAAKASEVIEEHAPFFVFGIHSIPLTTEEGRGGR